MTAKIEFDFDRAQVLVTGGSSGIGLGIARAFAAANAKVAITGRRATAAAVSIFKQATSLGGVESLIEHRASIEGAGTDVPPDLLRLSIGIEEIGDLIADLDQALANA